jgi:hypothetical protein
MTGTNSALSVDTTSIRLIEVVAVWGTRNARGSEFVGPTDGNLIGLLQLTKIARGRFNFGL